MPEHEQHPPASRPAPWRNPQVRAIAFQVIALAILAWAGYTIFQNTLHNMQERGIHTGFGFLGQPAGFGIIFSLIPYDETMSYGRTFLVGLLNTLLVSGIGIVLATIVGFIAGIARLSKNWLVSRIAAAYIEIFRNIPLLLQIFFWYFAVLRALPSPRQSMHLGDSVFLNNRGLYVPAPVSQPGMGLVWIALLIAIVAVIAVRFWARRRQLRTGQPFHTFWVGLAIVVGMPLVTFLATGRPISFDLPRLQGFNFSGGMGLIPEFVALLAALTIYTGTFIAETVRAGILSVRHGQTEAALSLGLPQGLVLRLVVIPQAMRVIIPPLTSQYLNLTKNSSLATAIGYPDLVAVFMGTTLNQTGKAVEIVAMTMAVYLAISLAISFVMNMYNRAVALKER